MPVFEKMVTSDIDGAGMDITPLLRTWTQVVKVFGFDPTGGYEIDADTIDDTSDWLVEASIQMDDPNQIPSVGSPHRKYETATCTRVNIMPMDGNSTTNLVARITYSQPGRFSSVEYDVSVGEEARNFDVDGNLTQVRYDPTLTGGQTSTATTDLTVPFITDVRIPLASKTIRVVQWENIDDVPAVLMDTAPLLFNSDEIWGFGKAELLYVGRRVSQSGTRLCQVDRYFMVCPHGNWSHFYAVYQTERGIVPHDVMPYVVNFNDGTIVGVGVDDPTVIFPGSGTYNSSHPLPSGVKPGDHNGASAFVMLNSVAFADYFTEVKPPFNPTSKPTVAPQ